MLKQLFDSITQGTPLLPLDLKAKPAVDPGLYRELLEPIDDGVGIDLSYEDEYAAIQDQVSKCAEVDDSVVLGNATMLLRDRGKDLRAAVFMAYSSLRVDGLSGTLQVFALIRALIERFGDDLHPRKPAARRAALEWLCNDRYLDPLTVRGRLAPESALLSLQGAIDDLVTSVRRWPEGARPDLSALTRRVQVWLDESARMALGNAVSSPANSGTETGRIGGTGVSPTQNIGAPSATTPDPKSAQEAWKLVRKASAALRADPAWAAQGTALMRAARWSTLTELPPHRGGTTRVPAPRTEARAYVQALFGGARWDALLEESARLFNEGSNHFWLDLAHWTDQAWAHAGDDQPRGRLAIDVRELLVRLPNLPTLNFDDGSPFASPPARAWLQALLSPPRKTHDVKAGSCPAPPESLRTAAHASFKSKGLAAALELLQQAMQERVSQRERHELQRLMLELARDGGCPELALGLARELCAQADEFALARWDPALAFDAWSGLYQLLRAAGEVSQPEGLAVYRRLCGLDAARAASLAA